MIGGVLPALLLGPLAASSSPYECTYLTPHDKVPTRVHRYNGSMLVSWSPLRTGTPHSRATMGRGAAWGPLLLAECYVDSRCTRRSCCR